MAGLSEPIQLVSDRQDRMAEQHSGPGVAHDLPGLLSPSRFVAVYWAVGARRFFIAIGAFFQSQHGVVVKLLARRTQNAVRRIVVTGAINADHLRHR